MRKLTQADTQKIVNSYVKTYGQSSAARKLTEIGYRSPEGASILQAHIFRIVNGSGTCLLAPETENQQQQQPPEEKPIAVPKRQKQIAEELFQDEELLQEEITKTAKELREDLIEEQRELEALERSLPPLVPCTGNHPHREHRHMERDVRVSAIFNRRGAVELAEDRSFYGIPCMHYHSPTTTSKPYHPRSYGRNTISTRDLSIREK